MHYNLDTVRAMLRQCAVVDHAGGSFSSDGVILSPIGGASGEDLVAYADRLVAVGLLRRTNDIHMKHHPDPVTLRVTDQGRHWVRRAHDDEAWLAAKSELQSFLDATPSKSSPEDV